METKKKITWMMISFVWFSTCFGGGSSSGRTLVNFYVNHGWRAPLIAVGVQLFQGLVLYFAFVVAMKYKQTSYVGWAKKMYAPVGTLGSYLFEFVFLFGMIAANCAALATGSESIIRILGTSYFVNTIIIAVLILVFSFYTRELVGKLSKYLSYLIMISFAILYLPLFFSRMSLAVANISDLRTGILSVPGASDLGTALWRGLVQVTGQITLIGSYIVHSYCLTNKKDCLKAAVTGAIMNSFVMGVQCLVFMSFLQEGISTASMPLLFVIEKGVASPFVLTLFSLLVIMAVFGTGVSVTFAFVSRISDRVAQFKPDEDPKLRVKRNAIVCVVVIVTCWAISQMGLVAIINRVYSYLGYFGIPLIVIPVLIKGFIEVRNYKDPPESVIADSKA